MWLFSESLPKKQQAMKLCRWEIPVEEIKCVVEGILEQGVPVWGEQGEDDQGEDDLVGFSKSSTEYFDILLAQIQVAS